MKCVIMSVAVVASMFLLSAAGSAEMLTNGDFEGSTGWTYANGAEHSQSRNLTPVDGKWSGVGYFTGNYYPQIFQEVSASPGEAYTGSISAYCDRAALEDGLFAKIRLEFNDIGGAEISSAYGNVLSSVSPLNEWIRGTVTGTAPANTASIRFMVYPERVLPDGAIIYWDGASLTPVPEPAALGLLALGACCLLRRRR